MYHHLTQEERWQIKALKESGKSIRDIASQLSRSCSTISRELSRGKLLASGSYSPKLAVRVISSSRQRSGISRRKLQGDLWHLVRQRLLQCWSPQQISGRLELDAVAERINRVTDNLITQHGLPRRAKALLAMTNIVYSN